MCFFHTNFSQGNSWIFRRVVFIAATDLHVFNAKIVDNFAIDLLIRREINEQGSSRVYKLLLLFNLFEYWFIFLN